MDENKLDLEGKIDQLTELITGLVQKVDEQQTRIDELDSVLYDGLIGPANEAIAQNDYNNALSDFRTKYAEKLEPYAEVSKALEGDDFDVYKSAFDEYNEGGYDYSPDEYVDKLVTSLAEQIDKVKAAVAKSEGVKPEDVSVEIKTEDGDKPGETDVKVDVDNKETSEKPEDNVTEKETEHLENGEEHEVTEEQVTEGEKPEEAKEDDLEEFQKELDEEVEKDKEKSWIRG